MSEKHNHHTGQSRAEADHSDASVINVQKQPLSIWLPAFLFALFFFACCITPLIASFLGFETPNLEKRTLAAKPTLIVNGEINLKYTNQFDDWYGDTFSFRTYLISGWHGLNRLIPENSFNERVISGKGGWLYFSDTLDDYLRYKPLSDLELARCKTILDMQAKWLHDQDIAFIFTVAPNKNSIYPEFMPNKYKQADGLDKADQLAKSNIPSYVDLFSLIQSEITDRMDQADLFYHKEDSHWNNTGARMVSEHLLANAKELMQSDLPLENLPGQPIEYRQDWLGDLSVMLFPSGPKPDWQHYYSENAKYSYTRPIRSLEDMTITTQSDQGQTNLLMFRDSFANALIPMLSPAFQQAVYSRALPIDYRLIDEAEADIVIIEIVERNLRNIIESAPIMPARALAEVPHAMIESGQKITLQSESDIVLIKADEGIFVRLGGKIQHESLQNAIRVIVEVPTATNDRFDDRLFYEAFPIFDKNLIASVETAAAEADEEADKTPAVAKEQKAEASPMETSGFTITLDPETVALWQQTSQITLHFFDGSKWSNTQVEY